MSISDIAKLLFGRYMYILCFTVAPVVFKVVRWQKLTSLNIY